MDIENLGSKSIKNRENYSFLGRHENYQYMKLIALDKNMKKVVEEICWYLQIGLEVTKRNVYQLLLK